jgi:hypothetical protein
MAEQKTKKIDSRDLVYDKVASAIMQDSNLTKLRKHKEGLELNFNGEVFAVRVIKKKEDLDSKEFRGEYFHDEKENAFGFKSYKAS